MPSVSFELLNLSCLKAKRSDVDTVKLYLAATSETGDLDKLESNTGPTQQDIAPGEYDFHSGTTVVFADSPPLGRATWRSNLISISETSDVAFTVAGIGLHKAELGGGADPDSIAGKVAAIVRDNFVTLIPYVGKPVAALLKFAEQTANADPDKECYGPLFVFTRTYSGADLIFSLIKDPYQYVTFQAGDSADVEVHKDCRRPAYTATVLLRSGTDVGFSFEQSDKELSRSKPIALKGAWGKCKPDHAAYYWVIGREVVYRFKPKTLFNAFRYQWQVAGFGAATEVAEGSGDYTVRANVYRYDRETGEQHIATEDVPLHCTVASDGSLEIRVPETAGAFDLHVSCDLAYGDDHKRVYSKSFDVETEVIDGDAAYLAYTECVRGWWRQQANQFARWAERIRYVPSLVPHHDPAGLVEKWEGMAVSVDQLVRQFEKLSPRFDRRGRYK
jgi:hypothetical protein